MRPAVSSCGVRTAASWSEPCCPCLPSCGIDRPRRRLTALLEPGRIKRGLQPNVLAGPPLTYGTTVTVAVDSRIRDAAGATLITGAERTWRVVDPIRTRVDPGQWEVRWLESDQRRLVVRFGRSLDRALVGRCLTIVGPDGRIVGGRSTLDPDASTWTFTPALPASSEWKLHVHPDLEDTAGNSVRRAFDRDLQEPQDKTVPVGGIVLSPDW